MKTTNLTTELLAALLKSVNKQYGKRNRTLNILGITETQLWDLENGIIADTHLYRSFFALSLRRLVPRRLKLKRLPTNLPSKDKIVEMMQGKCEDLSEYYELVNALLTMPDLPQKTKKEKQIVVYKERCSKKTQKDWGKDALRKAASEQSLKGYGKESQITRKAWGSAYRPAHG